MRIDCDFAVHRPGVSSDNLPARTALTEFRRSIDSGEVTLARGLALCSLALACSTHHDRETATSAAQTALSLARAWGDRSSMRIALRALVACGRAAGRNEAALSFVRELGETRDRGALADEIELLERIDDVAAARSLIEQTQAWSDDGRRRWIESGVAVAEMRHNYAFESLDDAAETARMILRLTAVWDSEPPLLAARIMLSRIAQLQGDYALAHRHLRAAERLESRNDEWPALLLLTRASLAQSEGDCAGAHDIFRAVAARTRASGGLQCWLPTWLIEGMRSALRFSDTETARHIVAMAQAVHAGTPTSATDAAVAAQTAGLLIRDSGLLEEAVRHSRSSPRALVRGDAAVDYGHALLGQNRRGDGIAQLDNAWATFDAIGARARKITVQRELARIGVRRRKWSTGAPRPVDGWSALTETERRVSRLIAQGHTNRSAAAQLGSAPDTVCSQVRSIFGKLSISSRVHLARIVASEDALATCGVAPTKLVSASGTP